MAYDEVTEDNVYLCVGHPPRRDIENIVKWMLNDHFSVAYNSILYDLDSELLISFLFFCIQRYLCKPVRQFVLANLRHY